MEVKLKGLLHKYTSSPCESPRIVDHRGDIAYISLPQSSSHVSLVQCSSPVRLEIFLPIAVKEVNLFRFDW
jgi:hypothetical protein